MPQASKSGGEVGGKGLTQLQQRGILRDFRKGVHNVLVATSIGEEGLDIGEVAGPSHGRSHPESNGPFVFRM